MFGFWKCGLSFLIKIGMILVLILIFILLSKVIGFIGKLKFSNVVLSFLIGLFVISICVVLFI